MKKLYGFPYMGSKTVIADDILRQLPNGKRFVDLFGGGFAMSHAALLSGKYQQVFYNEYNPLCVDLLKRAINGEFSYKRFRPEFITREEFCKKHNTDGYIQYIWSFGSRGGTYIFGKDKEPLKKAAHDWVVFGKWSSLLEKYAPYTRRLKSMSIHNRRLEFQRLIKANGKRLDFEQLEQLERLERLERLTLIINQGSYLDYEYQEGDTVYCDPPYEKTTTYSGGFDIAQFYDWAASREYKLWFSSYKISDKRFKMVWAKQKRVTLNAKDNTRVMFECLYTNKG